MSPASVHGDPISPNGHHVESNPTSSTPTIDVAFDRPGLGEQASTAPPLWPHRLSASFSAMADQIAAASQALALVPSTAFSGSDLGAELGALKARVDEIERAQERLGAELEALKTQAPTQGGRVNVNVNGDAKENGQENANGIATVDEGEGAGGEAKAAVPDPAAQAAKIEELEKKLNELSETVKIDQQRLPARLHNSRATIMKASLKTPVTASGKPAPGFPSSRGEFEHITKERYEALLKAYGQPQKGDTEAKREALRTFAGIPQDEQ